LGKKRLLVRFDFAVRALLFAASTTINGDDDEWE
jgi:hypothetical protein